MYIGALPRGIYPDLNYYQNREIIACVKMYLGYAPYYSDHEYCRNEEYAALLQKRYGKDINGLMDQIGIKDFGPVKKPINNSVGPQADLIQAVKRIYQVEGLYFYYLKYRYYCSTKRPDNMQLDSGALKSLMESLHKPRATGPSIIFDDTGVEHKTLDSLRTEMFVVQLSGL